MTKGFAHGLLARIAMTYAGYSIRESSKSGYENMPDCDATYPTQRPGTEKRRELYTLAVKHLDAIIASGYHKLNPSYENEWYLLNQLTLDQTYQENLYEVAHGVSSPEKWDIPSVSASTEKQLTTEQKVTQVVK